MVGLVYGIRDTSQSRYTPLRYGVDTIWIEGDVILDRGDGCIRRFVGPHRIHRSVAAERNAVVSAVALVGQ